MSDTNESPKSKANLIKQPKIRPTDEQQETVSGEKRKVVVKKKVVVRKPQVRVVARHEDDSKPEAETHVPTPTAETVPSKAAERISAPSEPQTQTQTPAPAPAPAPTPAPAAEAARKPAPPASQDDKPQTPRPYTPPAGRTSGGYQGAQGGYQGRSGGYQGRPGGYQGGGYQGNSGGSSSSGGYQGRPGGYQGGQSGGYQGRPGGYQGGQGGQSGGYQGNSGGSSSSGGYQGRPGGYQGGQGGQSGGYQGRPGGYQGGQGGQSGGYQGRPGGYQGGQSGGYQGRPGGYQGGPGGQSGGYQGRPGGYQGGQGGQGGGYQGRPGGYQGGQGGGYQGRPGGYQGGPGRGPGGPNRGPGARGPGSGPATTLDKRPQGPKRFIKSKKPVYNKRDREEELSQKLNLAKKKQGAIANPIPTKIDILETISVSELARKMNLKPSDLISKLMKLGFMATINQQIDSDTATILAGEYGCEVRVVSLYDETVIEKDKDKPEDLVQRPPIVAVMGHVDHGKTKLLDAIRKTDVVSGEFGGITQHIGAYQVESGKGKITFLDTPGHEAFTKMRARGSQVTDIVILVVAATEGVMPQTLEALDHAKAAGVPVIVAINKIDLPDANPDRVKTQLSEKGLVPEDWGGTTMFCEISALKKQGISELMDAILLQAEILELKANYSRHAEGKIIESKIDHGRGIVSTVLIGRGTLRVGDCFVAGIFPGKVRALYDDHGIKVEEAPPSFPVEVIGFEGMPNSGDPFEVVEDEKFARLISDKRQELKRYEQAKTVKKVTLDNLYDTIQDGAIQELKVVIKGDVHGSVEALKSSLEKLSTKEIRLNVIHASAGAIHESDVMLASASNALIIGFNVRPTPKAKILADQEKVDIRKYNVIYKAVEEIEKAMEGMLAPEFKEQDIAQVEVRETFHVPKIGVIAGCMVLEGTVKRNAGVRVIREGVEIFSGKIVSLKRFKDDAKEVAAGFECGIGVENCTDIKVGDTLEVFEQIQVSRKLS